MSRPPSPRQCLLRRKRLRFEALEPRLVLDSTVVFNEVMYHPVGDQASLEWIEFYNQLSAPIDLTGWRVSGGIDFQFPANTVLSGGQYLVIAASPSALQAASGYSGALGPFSGRLSDGGELLELRDGNDRVMDALDYGDSAPWPIAADGGGSSLAKSEELLSTGDAAHWSFSQTLGGTPGASNHNDGTVSSMPIVVDSTWKYNDDGVDLGTSWRTVGYSDASWKSGAGLFYDENDPLSGPKNTPLTPGRNAYYFRKTFQFDGNPADVTQLMIDLTVDDGAVVYLNGVEVQRLNMPGGAVTYSTRAASAVDNATSSGPLSISASNLVNGANVLAVEVHQADPTATSTLAYYRFEEATGTAVTNSVDGISDGQLVGADRSTDVPAASIPQTGAANNRSVNFANSYALINGQTFIFHDPSVGGATGGATLEWYMKVPTAEDHSAIFWSNTTSADADRFNIFWNASFTGVPGTDRSVSGDFVSPVAGNVSIGNHTNGYAISLNQWHHYAIVRVDNTPTNLSDANFTWNWYVDGQLVPSLTQTTTAALPTSNNGWLIAGRQGGASLNALLDEVRLTKGALSPSKFLNATNTSSADDDDVVFGASLTIVQRPTPAKVALNEIAPGGSGFQVELANYGSAAVNVGGYVLRRDSGTSVSDFALPAASLGVGQYVAFTAAQLGFIPQVGDKLFLYGPGRSIALDGAAVTGALEGRLSPGLGEWYAPSGSSFGGANVFQLNTSVVINEIMYHHAVFAGAQPDSVVESPEEWVELYNRGASTVNLSGWRFAEAIDYAFPAGTMLAPGGYLVVANDAALLQSQHPGATVIGNFSGSLSNSGERIRLFDATGNLADEVRYYDEKPWPGFADGGGSSLELRDPDADNSLPESWAASDEAINSSWQTYTYRGIAGAADSGSPQYNEFIFGMLDSGEILLDDISVIEDPSGTHRQLIQNGSFSSGAASTWRIIGNHHGSVITDPTNAANKVLHITANGRTDDMHNHAETTLKSGGVFVSIVPGREYEISYRAKWLGGSNQLNTRLFFNRLQETTRIAIPSVNGTPGGPNSRRVNNAGPTFSQLQNGPVVPTAGQGVTVSVAANDPDGVTSMQLRWRTDGGAWSISPMSLGSDRRYAGTIPGLPAGTKVQFFVRGTDALGATADYPAAAENSRAMYIVDDGQSRSNGLHNFRIIMSSSDVALLDSGTNLMSNDLLGATVVVDESEVYYDVGVRRSGAASSRQGASGFRVEFHADQLFRGVHETVTLDRNHNEEIFVRQLINRAGDIPGMYNDLVYLIAPTSDRTGFAQMKLAAFENEYLDSQYPNGSDGTEFEKELIYRQQLSNPADPESLKVPFGYTHPPELNTDIADLGSDPEAYRWNWLIKNNRDIDDYSSIIALNQALSLTGGALDLATRNVMDVDEWLRSLAAMRLTGNRDFYSQPKSTGASDSWRHNFWVYQRPSDGRLLILPWDIDENFQVAATDLAIFGNENIAKVIQLPDNLHYYWGHIDDLITQAFNPAYMSPWASAYSALLGGQNIASGMDYITARAAYLRSRMPAAEDFRLADGVNLQTALVQAGAPAKALIPSSGVLGNTWTGGNEAAFASLGGDASWLSGASGAGYQRAGTDNNFAGLYGIDVAAMDHGNDSVYVRIPFNVSTQEVLNSITSLSLQMRYDDGFVAYLNGVKVAAANAPASPQWNSGATASVTDGAAVVPVSFDITAFKGSLKVGANILAIQGLNQAGANSSDLLVLPELIATRTTTTPSVVNDSVVDVSGRGWVNVREIRVAGDPTPLAVTWSSPTTWTARVPLQPGLNALTLEAYDFQGNKITTPYPNNLTVTSTLSERPYQDFLKISEIMYHPADPTTAELAAGFADSDEFEFLEFFNASETETLDLNGVRIVSGPSAEFNFSGSNVTSLGPGESVIVVRNQAAFEARYGTSLSNRIAGVYEGKLDNAGELLAVIDPAGVDIERFTYDDVAPWPVEADGLGYSLVRVAPRSMTNPALASSWKASYVLGGSPAAIDLASGPSAADFTLDAAVGPPDLTVWKSGFGTALTVGYNAGDADGDHDVDGADFLTWQRSLGLSSFPASPNIMVNASANVRAAEEPVAVIDVGSEGERDIESRLPSLAAGRLLGGDLRSRDLAFAAIGSAAAKLAGHDNDHWLRRQSHAKSPSILSVESCTWLDDQPINSVARSLVSHDKSKDSLLRVVQNRWPTEASAGDVEIQSLRRYLTTALPRGFLRRRQA